MEVITTIVDARRRLDGARGDGAVVGLVPTMGFLHDGHVSLMDAAVAHCDYVMATIFVNPLQFGQDEDLDKYPTDLEQDVARSEAAGVDLLLVPSVGEMYPEPIATEVSVGALSALLDGRTRPTHFAGVATVVSKLFNIGGHCQAYFGEKDWQQLQVVKKMVVDLSFPVEVVGCPIVREPDGLAMSSRNVYLDPDDRRAAQVLSQALRAGVDAVADGEVDPEAIEETMAAVVSSEPRAELDYVAAVDGSTLRRPEGAGSRLRLLVAAQVGPARLIDNVDATAAHGLPG